MSCTAPRFTRLGIITSQAVTVLLVAVLHLRETVINVADTHVPDLREFILYWIMTCKLYL